jgi:ribosomal protein S18 acetylase RimI-like enzyme
MSISFGIEFEFDYIKPNNEKVVLSGREPIYLSSNWSYQNDPTASSELRTPILTSLEQYITECNNQFGNMINQYPNLIPYMYNEPRRSLGQHIHIGRPRSRLSREAKRKIAKQIIKYYPFLASIQAQPIPSYRGLNSSFCLSMSRYNDIISTDHYAEISDSHIGTVELRLFDCNIPQSSLVNIFFLTLIAKKSLFSRRDIENDNNNNDFDFNTYQNERNKALRYGLIGLDITSYLRKIRSYLGNIEIPNIPSLREALFLICRYRINFYGLWKYINAKPYDYMKKCLEDTSKYLENLKEIPNINHKDKLEQWINRAIEIENLDQLIGLSIGVDKSLSQSLLPRLEQIIENQPRRITITINALGRSEVREAIENHNYRILRINEVPRYDINQVAEIISYLLFYHGDNMVNPMTPREIIESSERFYVFVVNSQNNNNIQICGAIAVRLSDGEIKSLVVDRRYRRLGIGRLLILHALNVLRENHKPRAIAWIRTNNIVNQRLNESLGFRPIQRNDRAILYEKVLNGA